MSFLVPAARGLRNLYALSSEQIWFLLAVLAGLILAAELVEVILLMNLPAVEQIGF